jgi:hypothetical protein
MGCLLALTTGVIPRFLVAVIWLVRPAAWDAAFGGPLVPILGVIFLPFTTLMYVTLYSVGQGLSGVDIVALVIAFAADLFGIGASGYGNRDKVGFANTMD